MRGKHTLILSALLGILLLCLIYTGTRDNCSYIAAQYMMSSDKTISEVQRGNLSLNKEEMEEREDIKKEFVSETSLDTHDPFSLDVPLPFLRNYKNPCFLTEESLYCLPYFFFLTAQKSGTTDLYNTLTAHPMIVRNIRKEFHWWNRARFPLNIHELNNMTIRQYMDCFHNTTENIRHYVGETSQKNQSESVYHPRIMGDFTASYLYDQLQWKRMPQNAGSQQAKVLTAHAIRHLLPRAKFIVIVRDPSSRMFSDYCYYTKRRRGKPSEEMFHKRVTEGIAWFKSCMDRTWNGSCIYDVPEYIRKTVGWHPDLDWDPVVRLRASLYGEFLADWFKVFDKKQFFIFRFEDYTKDRLSTSNEIFKFLGLEPMKELPLSKPQRQTQCPIKLQDDTKKLLDKFYNPYNMKLAKLLDDNRYLWDETG